MASSRHRSRWRTLTAAAVAVAAVLVLAMTALDRPGPSVDAAALARPGAQDSGGPFSLTSTDGRTIAVPGSRPTVLFFMAWWCVSCVEEGKAIQALEGEYEDRVEFVAVETTPNATTEEVADFKAQANNPDNPYVVDRRGELIDRYDVTTLDTTILIASDGEILARVNGDPLGESDLRAFLEGAL